MKLLTAGVQSCPQLPLAVVLPLPLPLLSVHLMHLLLLLQGYSIPDKYPALKALNGAYTFAGSLRLFSTCKQGGRGQRERG